MPKVKTPPPGEAIVQALIDHPVPFGGRTTTVRQVATAARIDAAERCAVEKVGMALVQGSKEPRAANPYGQLWVFLFLPKVAELIDGTPWEGVEWKVWLKAMPGATYRQRTILGERRWGVQLPLRPYIGTRPFTRAA